MLPFLSTHMLWKLKGNTWEQDRDEGWTKPEMEDGKKLIYSQNPFAFFLSLTWCQWEGHSHIDKSEVNFSDSEQWQQK